MKKVVVPVPLESRRSPYPIDVQRPLSDIAAIKIQIGPKIRAKSNVRANWSPNTWYRRGASAQPSGSIEPDSCNGDLTLLSAWGAGRAIGGD